MRFVHLGFAPDLVDYEEGWQTQREVHAQVVDGTLPDTTLLLEHAAVYTAGKRTEPHERPVDGTPVIDVDRGGKITWHGPGQLVGYPIVRLPEVPIDVVAHVRRLEEVDDPRLPRLRRRDRARRRAQRGVGARRRRAVPTASSARSACGSAAASRCTGSPSTATPTCRGPTRSSRAASPTPGCPR